MEFEKALQVIPMRCPHPRHRCSGKHETGAKRQLPGVSNPGAGLRVAGETFPHPPSLPAEGQEGLRHARRFVAAPQWRAGELRTRGRARRRTRGGCLLLLH